MVRCAACGTVGASQRCGACRYPQYCNAACQRGHWKAGHKQECKSICAAAPLSAEDIRRLSLPGLVDFICSPGVLVADAAKQAAKSLVCCHEKCPLSKELSRRVTKGLLDVVERLYEERIALIEAPCEAIFAVLNPDLCNLVFDEGGILVVVGALRTALGCADPALLQAILKSGCEIIAAVANLNGDCRPTLVAAGVVPVLLQAILQPGRVAPTYVFDALRNSIEPQGVGDSDLAAIAESVQADLPHIVDATFCALTSLFDFNKDNEDDVAMLTHAGCIVKSVMLYLGPDFGGDRSSVMSFSFLLFGDGRPNRLPALVNALRASISGIEDSANSEHIAGAFASAISGVVNGVGWASTRATVEAGAIPALLAALRRLGESSPVVAYSSSAALRKLQLSGREGSCAERIVDELSMGGMTQKLLRRLRDVWRVKAAVVAADSASGLDSADAQSVDRWPEMIVAILSALLADMPKFYSDS